MTEIQKLIRDIVSGDANYNNKAQSYFGAPFNYFIDLSEIKTLDELPAFVIHKNFYSDNEGKKVFAIQLNLIALLGDYVDNMYPNIERLEELAIEAIELCDKAICAQLGVKRVGYNMFVAAPIDGTEDIEFVVLIQYESISDYNFI